ncbi:T3SS effector HopA1 family protein [Streptomyces sp. NPDC006649]|uniref:T3SS effector HopA1 family protein n=1 Tax=Streptomyces sp. NPDC006649 TaxID=3156896 RepID=UPI0033B8F969
MINAAQLAPRIADALRTIDVEPGGLKATTPTETIESDNAAALAKRLSSELYQILHVGRTEAISSRPRTYRDRDLDRLFAVAMPHRHTQAPVVIHEHRPEQEEAIAELGGLRLRVQPSALTPLPNSLPGRSLLTLPAARPGLSPGFFLADGSLGMDRTGDALRLYVHLTNPEAAPSVWGRTLSLLEDARLPYRAKISSSPHLYPRRDALVVYLGPRSWQAIPLLAAELKDLEGVGPSTSPFTTEVAPGVAVAWEPNDPRAGRRGQSFGEHRTAILAEALVLHATLQPEERPTPEDTVAGAFLDASIDPLEPSRNLDSPPLSAFSMA